ncbi:DUF5672 family protein [Bacteroides sedimenti]|uniref:DUF5672 domain-containing protein n=1 Tax=Bacteroides sedimenti TaxID=2136147 RepID=A0ABM8IDS4_9BACE
MKKLVNVLIPIYQNNLSSNDLTSLRQCYKINKKYDITIIKPEGLDLSAIHNEFPGIEEQEFAPSFFDGIEGYNRLMLSPDFYKRFLDYKYILIHQLDVFLFSDSLEEWCNKDYDYVGAPWILRPVYQRFPINLFCKLKGIYRDLRSLPNRQKIYFKVGNGGLSLRKTESFYHISLSDRETIEYYISMKNKAHCFNEDVYWALEAKKILPTFSTPDYKEALEFSFDKYPALCYKMNGNRLPYGCHSWTKKKMNPFWEPIINKSR